MNRIYLILFVFLLASKSALAILIIPLPNVAIPATFQKIIDAYESSTETKAVALASEDKTFGSKQWVIGHFSGMVTQDEANGRAMSSCLQALDQAKKQSVAGKQLYDFGNKTCELYNFKNTKNSSNSNVNTFKSDDCKKYSRGGCSEREKEVAKTSSDNQANSKNNNTEVKTNTSESKITIDLPQGWIVKDFTEAIKRTNPEMYSCNLTINGCFIYWSYPESHIYSLSEFINTTRISHVPSASISNLNLSNVDNIELYGKPAYRYTVTGLVNNIRRYTYQYTFFKIGNKYIKVMLWVPENRYSDLKDIINMVIDSFGDASNPKIYNNFRNQANENKGSEDLSNLPVPMN